MVLYGTERVVGDVEVSPAELVPGDRVRFFNGLQDVDVVVGVTRVVGQRARVVYRVAFGSGVVLEVSARDVLSRADGPARVGEE